MGDETSMSLRIWGPGGMVTMWLKSQIQWRDPFVDANTVLPVIAIVNVVYECFQFCGIFCFFTKVDNINCHVILLHLLCQSYKRSFICFNGTAYKDNNALTLISVLSMFQCKLFCFVREKPLARQESTCQGKQILPARFVFQSKSWPCCQSLQCAVQSRSCPHRTSASPRLRGSFLPSSWGRRCFLDWPVFLTRKWDWQLRFGLRDGSVCSRHSASTLSYRYCSRKRQIQLRIRYYRQTTYTIIDASNDIV